MFAPAATDELEEPRRRVCCEDAERTADGATAAAAAAATGGGGEDKGCCCSAACSVPVPALLLSVGDCIGDAVVERRRCSPGAGGAGHGVGFTLWSPLMSREESARGKRREEERELARIGRDRR